MQGGYTSNGNIYFSFDGLVLRQVVGTLLGASCATLSTDLFLYSYESDSGVAHSSGKGTLHVDAIFVLMISEGFKEIVAEPEPNGPQMFESSQCDFVKTYFYLQLFKNKDKRIFCKL